MLISISLGYICGPNCGGNLKDYSTAQLVRLGPLSSWIDKVKVLSLCPRVFARCRVQGGLSLFLDLPTDHLGCIAPSSCVSCWRLCLSVHKQETRAAELACVRDLLYPEVDHALVSQSQHGVRSLLPALGGPVGIV